MLLALAPGYRAETGALSTAVALQTARRLVRAGEATDPIRARLALVAIRRLKAIDAEAAELDHELGEMVEATGASRLGAICGVGTIVAAKILGETDDVDRFPSGAAFAADAGVSPIPASSAGRRHGTASTAVATASSTARSSRSRWSRPAGTPRAARISLGNAARARRRPRLAAV